MFNPFGIRHVLDVLLAMRDRPEVGVSSDDFVYSEDNPLYVVPLLAIARRLIPDATRVVKVEEEKTGAAS